MRSLSTAAAGRAATALAAILRLAVATSLVAAAPVQADSRRWLESTMEGVFAYRLDNGLTVLLVPRAAAPDTAVVVSYRGGAAVERDDEAGVAHLLEHLVAKGGSGAGSAHAEMSRRGMQHGANTSHDRTTYFARFAADDDSLQWLLSLYAGAMFGTRVGEAEIEAERPVIRAELHQVAADPGRTLMDRALSAMFGAHPYGRSPFGPEASLDRLDPDRVQAYFRDVYRPDNATLVIAGRFDVDRTWGSVARHFGTLKRPPWPLRAPAAHASPQEGERSVAVQATGNSSMVLIGVNGPPGAHADAAALALLTLVLADGQDGRLHRRLVEGRWAAATMASLMAWSGASPFFVGAALGPGQAVDRARRELARVLDELAVDEVSQEELDRARGRWSRQWQESSADSLRLANLLADAAARGDWRSHWRRRDEVEGLALPDLRRVVRERFVAGHRTLATLHPADASGGASPPPRPEASDRWPSRPASGLP